ncbi:MAG: hypothetical protein GBAus27B_000415 [Mycoplasmataceae bacterium]|nr:MAG: hypothetical protein GBAus27B_000415 [Mycoplasmataceae bacterium]
MAMFFIVWDSCPNLSPENIDKYNCGGDFVWDQLSHDQFEQGKLEESNKKFNQELNLGFN